ncbi:NAD(P)H-dependent oxidoreductase [Rugosimonospora acidiphila]|uniref:NAD(P)H-dependent oxidoreductase n=1 Tax=Rugosimonospora acidiphila TaxID=556531 RepID=A0ABP9SWZ6_9ACTN
MIRIAIVVGSTRPGRRGEAVARWVQRVAAEHAAGLDAAFTVVDIAEFDLPLLDEPVPAMFGQYRNPHTKKWSGEIGRYDGFVFVTPEYNHSAPAALKNAIDYLFAEWNDKAAGFVSYGVGGGARAVESLRLALAEVKVAGVRTQVELSLSNDFVAQEAQPDACAPGERQGQLLARLLGEVSAWSRALRAVRVPDPAATDRDAALAAR